MKIGDVVRVDKCDKCPKVIGKTAVVKSIAGDTVELSFGRGRPQKDRPNVYLNSEVSNV